MYYPVVLTTTVGASARPSIVIVAVAQPGSMNG
jgi:hypothetical protein